MLLKRAFEMNRSFDLNRDSIGPRVGKVTPMYRSGSTIIRWQSMGSFVTLRIARTTGGPMVMLEVTEATVHYVNVNPVGSRRFTTR